MKIPSCTRWAVIYETAWSCVHPYRTKTPTTWTGLYLPLAEDYQSLNQAHWPFWGRGRGLIQVLSSKQSATVGWDIGCQEIACRKSLPDCRKCHFSRLVKDIPTFVILRFMLQKHSSYRRIKVNGSSHKSFAQFFGGTFKSFLGRGLKPPFIHPLTLQWTNLKIRAIN